MKKSILFLTLFFPIWLVAQNYSDSWEEYFSYFNIKDIAEGNEQVITASENALFITNIYNVDDQIKLTTIDGLAGDEISAIAFSKNQNLILIGYDSGLLQTYDLSNKKVRNFIDIVQKPTITPEERHINSFFIEGNKAYIAANYGVSVFNLSRMEFGDTYYIGDFGDKLAVNSVCLYEGHIFTATQGEGLRYADLSNPNLVDYSQWSQVSQGNYSKVIKYNNRLYALNPDNQLEQFIEGQLVHRYNFVHPVMDMKVSDQYLSVTSEKRVQVLNENLYMLREYTITDFDAKLQTGLTYAGKIYMGDANYGLMETNLQGSLGLDFISPNGPLRNDIFALDVAPDEIRAAYGDYSFSYNPYPLKERGLSHYIEGQWINIPYEQLPDFRAITSVAINPLNPTQVFYTSFHDGLLEVVEDQVAHFYTTQNSDLPETESPFEENNAIRLSPITFDGNNNIWMGNAMNSKGLIKFSVDGGPNDFVTYNMSSVLPNPAQNAGFGTITTDQSGNVYLGTYKEGLIGFHAQTKKFAKIKGDKNQGNLPYNDVTALAVDHNNQLWIGTSRGLRVLYGPSQMFENPNTRVSNIVFMGDDGVPQELFAGLSITDIQVDGNNNKWIGSTAGVYQVSSDGQKTYYHFTKENSPLPSNSVNGLKIDGTTGKVYVATQKGMVAFKSSATSAQNNLKNVRVYPNPVRPRYEGMVTIDGLMKKANVKITDIEGNLVYEEFSKGGSIQWDTRAFGKYKVASGVYLVLITSEDQSETKVAKIMIIR